MKFTMAKTVLENMLSSLQAFLEKRDNSQITSHVLFQLSGGTLTLKATDHDMGFAIHTDQLAVESERIATCNGKKILDIVRILSDGDVSISAEGDEVFIRQNRSSYKLPSFNAAEYPGFPSSEGLPRINLDSSKLMTAFKKVNPAIATNNPKFELNGALLDIRMNVINVVATDTRRLALFKIENESARTLSLIIPKKAIQEIQKLFFNELELFYDDTNLIIQSEGYYFFTRVINGKYPDYERIIPRELRHTFTLPRDKMIDAIRQVNIITSEITMTFDNGQILFESLSNENMEAKTVLECGISMSEPVKVAVNSRYLIDFLTNIDSGEFNVGLNEPNTPFQMKSENFSSIVMPIIL